MCAKIKKRRLAEIAKLPETALALAVLAHVLIWSIAPALIIGNLHQDTLEAAYWGEEPSFGPARHPPLLSLAIQAVLRLDAAPIFLLLLMSQIGMALAALYVWRSARLFGGPRTAAVATMLFLISPAATFFAVQVNHNSLLAPFWAATLFYGLSILEKGRWGDAVMFGLVAGLGLLVKYELALLGLCLLLLALLVPRYRQALRWPPSALAVLVAAAILAPDVIWQAHNGGRAVLFALGSHKVRDLGGLASSVLGFVDGQCLLLAFPFVLLLLAARAHRTPWTGEPARIGAILAFGPSLLLLVAVIATDQPAKPLWVLPFTSSTAVGLTMLFPCDAGRPPEAGGIARRIGLFSGVAIAGFFAYLFIAEAIGAAIGQPFAFYAADSRKLGDAVENFWENQASGSLACVVIADRVLAASTVLWLRSRPVYVDFDSREWSQPASLRQCGKTGGIVVLTHSRHEDRIFKAYPALRDAPRRNLTVPAAFGFSHAEWPVELVFLAPKLF